LRIEIVKYPNDEDWLIVRNHALFTRRKSTDKVPDEKLKLKFLLSEHSPIYDLRFVVNFFDIPSWITVHYVRHHEGFIPFISSQRNDIQHEYDRKKAPQDTLVNMRFSGNAEAILNISRKRLCHRASSETRSVWMEFLNELQKYCPELEKCCVPQCVYRNGICPEVFEPCGYNKTETFLYKQEKYLKLFE